jgi:osmotically-inducible protein OsmY
MLDHSLEGAVMQALADNPLVHADELAVENRGGDVVLRGTVGTMIQRAEAVRAARRVPGVRTVDDRVRVRPLGIDGHADADTEAAVLDALNADDQLHAADIDVESRDGTVTLRGLVELAFQRDRAERVALAVGGVSHVHNELKVWLIVSADDVAERVTDAIVGAEQITVDVVDNDVTLTGTVASRADLDAALAAAANAPGVAEVHNHLSVRADP